MWTVWMVNHWIEKYPFSLSLSLFWGQLRASVGKKIPLQNEMASLCVRKMRMAKCKRCRAPSTPSPNQKLVCNHLKVLCHCIVYLSSIPICGALSATTTKTATAKQSFITICITWWANTKLILYSICDHKMHAFVWAFVQFLCDHFAATSVS